MIPELGTLFLVIALVASGTVALLAAVYACGVRRLGALLACITHSGIYVLSLAICGAFVVLAYSFLVDDFTVAYVAENSNSKLPLLFKISAVWGGHEGSLLLWLLLIAVWTLSVSLFSRANKQVVQHVVWVLCGVFFAFVAFTLFTSNPFVRVLLSPPSEGGDLNPLLQDIGLALHPPLLYVGYVGFAVSFAFAIVALCHKDFSQKWASWMRPWANVAWAFLGFGIVLGSWWAYYELGWGGYWFWDPVENASFMPWLLGTALVHSLLVLEKRGAFRRWCALLAIATFGLSILGTFLVRSGILDSVHAFASSPERGRFLLLMLSAILVAATLLYISRAQSLQAHHALLTAKDGTLLVNNFLLVMACFVVLLGTLYPIVLDLLNLGRISVGPPYFEAMFVPLVSGMALVATYALLLPWVRSQLGGKTVIAIAIRVWLLALVLAALFVWFVPNTWHFGAWVAMTLAFGLSISGVWHLLRIKQLSALGAAMGHIGFAFLIAGAALTHIYSIEQSVRVRQGNTFTINDIAIEALAQREVSKANYISKQFRFVIGNDTTAVAEKRFYPVRQQTMTEAAIVAGFFGDVFIALGEQFQDGSWSVSLQYKAFIRWVWLGGILISFGAIASIAVTSVRRMRAH